MCLQLLLGIYRVKETPKQKISFVLEISINQSEFAVAEIKTT